jgi:hypothetical protein
MIVLDSDALRTMLVAPGSATAGMLNYCTMSTLSASYLQVSISHNLTVVNWSGVFVCLFVCLLLLSLLVELARILT